MQCSPFHTPAECENQGFDKNCLSVFCSAMAPNLRLTLHFIGSVCWQKGLYLKF